jgi:hypothetical protein
VPFGWLTPDARRALAYAIAEAEAREPVRPRARLRFWQGLRSMRIGTAALAALGRDENVLVAHPLSAPEVAAAIARAAPRGFRGRTEGMQALFGEHLPRDVLARSSKAAFDDAFFNRHGRAFASSWDGEGLPEDVVDVAALRREWASGAPAAQSLALLQVAWLARDMGADGSGRERGQQPLDSLLQRPGATGPAHMHEP